MSEFDVLKALFESDGEMEWSALMNTDKSVQETSGVLQMLLHNGYIAGPLSAHSSVKITSTGHARYLQLECGICIGFSRVDCFHIWRRASSLAVAEKNPFHQRL